MSEYIEIEPELSDDETTMRLYTNLPLAEAGVETYASLEEMEEGSPVAQALSVVEGIETLVIDGRNLTLTRSPATDWYAIVADISAALKEFFL
ncbi:MAG: hypothetical protein HF973_10115 [Chloroflexi bacterium]|nr:hypothetical protein [Chloroflexota bacterium]